MLSDLWAEQDQKRKALQLTKVPKAKTDEVGTQAAERTVPVKLVDVFTILQREKQRSSQIYSLSQSINNNCYGDKDYSSGRI